MQREVRSRQDCSSTRSAPSNLGAATAVSVANRVSLFSKFILALTCLGLLVASPSLQAQEPSLDPPPPPLQEETPLRWSARASTAFPFFAGVGGAIEHRATGLEFGIDLGAEPPLYSDRIADLVANVSDRDDYGALVRSAFDANWLLRVGLGWRPSGREGFSFAAGWSLMQTRGLTGIDDVLAAVTGRDFSTLTAALAAAGRDPRVQLETTLSILELNVEYAWALDDRWSIGTGLGFGKIIGSSASLQTGLPRFEASRAGSALLRGSEDDLEAILVDYGYLPSIRLALTYSF